MDNLSLNDNGFTFKELEKIIYKYACDKACKVLKEVLEGLYENLTTNSVFPRRKIRIHKNI